MIRWFLGLLLIASSWANEQAVLQAHQQQKKILSQKIAALQRALEKDLKQKSALDKSLQNLAQSTAQIIQEQRRIEQQIRVLQQEMQGLAQQKKQWQAQIKQHQRRLAYLIRSAYISGQDQVLKLILNQQDPAQISRLLIYHRYLSEEGQQQLKQLQQKIQALNQLEQHWQQKQAQLHRLHEEQQLRLEQLQQQRKDQLKLAHLLEQRLKQQRQQLKRWQQDQARLDRLIAGIERALNAIDLTDKTRFDERKGQLDYPAPPQKIIASFGQERSGDLHWKGLLLAVPPESEVKAVHAGRVVYADWLRGYGLLIIIDHGDGYMSLYGQNQALFKEVGYWVEAGELIAQSGERLYFALRHHGHPINPLPWFNQKRGSS